MGGGGGHSSQTESRLDATLFALDLVGSGSRGRL